MDLTCCIGVDNDDEEDEQSHDPSVVIIILKYPVQRREFTFAVKKVCFLYLSMPHLDFFLYLFSYRMKSFNCFQTKSVLLFKYSRVKFNYNYIGKY